MPKPGKALERLVSTIEHVLRDEKTVQIESPKRMRDRTTGKLREHDIVLTIANGHHSVLVALECRDRSRPIGVPDVEAFSAKCHDTGINQGIIVSPRGFRTSGRKKAGHLGIRCLDLQEVDSFNWLLAPGFVSIERRLLSHDWKFFPKSPGLVTNETMEVLSPDGTPLDPAILAANAQRLLNKYLPSDHEPTEHAEIKIRVDASGFTLRNSRSGATTPVSFVGVTLTYQVAHTLIPFRFSQYLDSAHNQHITDVAVADFRFGERTGSIMIVYKEDKGGQVVFVPGPANDT